MELKYLDEGIGPPVLLLHAFPLNHAMWAPQVEHLKRSYRVIAPDVWGFGKSTPRPNWKVEQFGRHIADLLDKLEVESCPVVGLSMGGYIALPFSVAYPDHVSGLVLANTRARADNEVERNGRTEMIAALEERKNSVLADRMLPRLLKPNAAPEAVQKVRSIIEEADPSAAIYALMAMRDRPDSSTALHRISCPLLVIGGEQDMITRIEECREMAESAEANFVSIPDAGHLTNIDNPAAFNSALDAFLPVALS